MRYLPCVIVVFATLMTIAPARCDEITYGVITNDITFPSAQGGKTRQLLKGEVVIIQPHKDSDKALVQSVDDESMSDIVIERSKVATTELFLPLKEWKGQNKFQVSSESYDSVCNLQLHSNGTFTSQYDCNCENNASNKGILYRNKNILWAKNACGTKGLAPWSIFVIKDDQSLCYVKFAYGPRVTECWTSEDTWK